MRIRSVAAAMMTLAVSSIGVAQEVAGIEVQKKADVFGGIGFGNFAQDLGNLTNTGVGWGLRVGAQPFTYAGGEIAYQGINSGVDTIIQNNTTFTDRSISMQQISANAKIGVPFDVNDRELRPYGLLGIGYARIGVDNVLESVGLRDDNLLTVPLGVGVTYNINDVFAVDGRFIYNFLSGEDQPLANDEADSWNALVNVGATFGN